MAEHSHCSDHTNVGYIVNHYFTASYIKLMTLFIFRLLENAYHVLRQCMIHSAVPQRCTLLNSTCNQWILYWCSDSEHSKTV